MNQTQLTRFRRQLTEQLSELNNQPGEAMNKEQEQPLPKIDVQKRDNPVDPTHAGERQQGNGTKAHLIAQIKLALERIYAGSYGYCSRCHGEIPPVRLEAKPSVSLCLDCQLELEIQTAPRP